ncbi:hypothetical protein ACYB9C_28620, partial [Klebsiella pneumoniae]
VQSRLSPQASPLILLFILFSSVDSYVENDASGQSIIAKNARPTSVNRKRVSYFTKHTFMITPKPVIEAVSIRKEQQQ